MGVGGLVDIVGREKAPGFWARWAARLPLLKMAVHGPDRKNGLAREAQRANIFGHGIKLATDPQHLPAQGSVEAVACGQQG
jgi:hypothetical protein